MRIMTLAMSAATLAVSLLGCSVPDSTVQRNAEIRACGLQDDSSITSDVDLRACAPGNTKKTTICHIPPGNPDNAHTLCVGNSAVPAHVQNHHDTLGPCPSEPPCDGGDVDAGTGTGPDSGTAIDAGVDAAIDSGIIIF
jgi:hypothetical protein